MRLVPGSLSRIASAVGVDKGTISRWRSGEAIPSATMRARLHALYAVDPAAWERRPLGSEAPAPERRSDPADADKSTLEETLWLIRQIKDQLDDSGLSASERKGLTDNLTKLLALRGRLEEKAELMEARIVREHPRWNEIVRSLPDVLRPFPQAAEAVAAWLAEVGVES